MEGKDVSHPLFRNLPLPPLLSVVGRLGEGTQVPEEREMWGRKVWMRHRKQTKKAIPSE